MSAEAERSFVYGSVWAYRSVMILLYGTDYWRRVERVAARLRGSCGCVVELCCGDARLGERCRADCIAWTGVEFNPVFCRHARAHALPVIEADVWHAELPHADAYVMMAALYHFHDRVGELFDRVFARTPRLVLSEPVRNLSAGRGPVARLSQRLTNPGTGAARFRYDGASLRAALAREAAPRRLAVEEISEHRDLLVEVHV